MRLLFAGLAFVSALCSFTARANAAPDKPLIVAVLYFDYQGKDEELLQLRKGLTSMLISDLSNVGAVELVERVDLEKILGELDLQKKRFFDKKTVARVGKGLGAQVLVTGRYFVFRGKLLINAKVMDVERGTVKGVKSSRPVSEFFEIEQELASKLEALLAGRATQIKSPARGKRKRRRARPPKKLKTRTAVRYGRALDALDSGKKKRAKKLLTEVVKEQPDFELANLGLLGLAQ